MKARTRVAAAILAFAALPLILVNVGSVMDRRADAARAGDLVLSGNADELAALLAATRSRWLESVRADARLPGVDEMLAGDGANDPVRTSRFFAAIGSRDAVNINAIGLLDLEGRVVEDSRAVNRRGDESLEPWFLRVLATGQPQMVGPYAAPGESVAGLYFTALVRDADERRRGVLRVRMEPSVLGQVMASALVATPGLSATLLDEDGRELIGVGALGETALDLGADPGGSEARVLSVDAERVAIAPVARRRPSCSASCGWKPRCCWPCCWARRGCSGAASPRRWCASARWPDAWPMAISARWRAGPAPRRRAS